MWTCPKCGREFKRRNQGHYCGKAPENVDEYISLQEEKAQNHLNLLRKTILECIQDVNEKIAWSMPTYTKNGYSISFSTCKNHINLYIDAAVLEMYRNELADFERKKNALYLPYDKEILTDVIKCLVKKSFGE